MEPSASEKKTTQDLFGDVDVSSSNPELATTTTLDLGQKVLYISSGQFLQSLGYIIFLVLALVGLILCPTLDLVKKILLSGPMLLE